jgi:hypothetical protein
VGSAYIVFIRKIEPKEIRLKRKRLSARMGIGDIGKTVVRCLDVLNWKA